MTPVRRRSRAGDQSSRWRRGRVHESVATPEGGKAIIAAALDKWGRIDILIHNAGIVRRAPLKEMTYEDSNWSSMFICAARSMLSARHFPSCARRAMAASS